VLPGILPLAPTFRGDRFDRGGAKGSDDGFRTTCLAGAKTIPAYLVFLATCYLLIGRVDYRLAILGGLAAWLAAALVHVSWFARDGFIELKFQPCRACDSARNLCAG
jgi:uncharacterized membrane protein (GlpM family)